MRSDDQKNPASITYSNHRTYQNNIFNQQEVILWSKFKAMQFPQFKHPNPKVFFFLLKETCYQIIKKFILKNAVSTIQTPKSQSLFFLFFLGNMLSYNQKVHSQSNIQNPPHTTSLFSPFGKIKMWPCEEKNHASSFKWCKPTYQNQSKSNILKETTAFFNRKQWAISISKSKII